MNIAAIWASLVLLQTACRLAGSQYVSPFSGQKPSVQQQQPQQPGQQLAASYYSGKRASTMAEPTCEELRAMWRYSKRQSRAAESTNELPVYRDPFSYNVWEAYPSHSPSYADDYVARSRSSAPPIFGKLTLKPGSKAKYRNGRMMGRLFGEMNEYGTVNRHPPRRQRPNYRVGGGGGGLPHSPPQAGSFNALKELIISERAHELQEQRKAEEMAARAAVLKEMTSGERSRHEPLTPNHLQGSLQGSYQDSNSYDYAQYVADAPELGQSLSKADRYGREYALR